MALFLNAEDKNFSSAFEAFLGSKREVSQSVDDAVRTIITKVREEGDEALFAYSKEFDRVDLKTLGVQISADEVRAAVDSVPQKTFEALKLAHDRVLDYHKKQLPEDKWYHDELGVGLGWRWSAVESVGLYVPGGTASYPSSVLMNAVPAKVAGVERIVMVVPTPDGQLNPLVLAAAELAGITEIYRVGGAQAVAALAYGTQTILPVAKIVGPGNAYVAAAKRQVFGKVGIDMIAGPSEVLVISDRLSDPQWIAADLLAQAEHDTAAQSILITDDAAFGREVEKAVESQLKTLKRAETARASWEDFGAIILVNDLKAALPLANRIAPEHLELAVEDPQALLPGVRNAGAVFIGRYTPEVIGDYVGGSNHVLPTARSARFSSGLSVFDYIKRTSFLELNAEQLRALGPAAIEIAESEGLQAHGRSVAIRLNL